MSKPLLRSDYRPLDFNITHTDLTVEIASPFTTVKSKLTFKRLNPEATTFTLDGQKLELKSLKINGQAHSAYTLTTREGSQGFQDLVVDVSSLADKDNFIVEIENTFDLDNNKTLSGIYKAGDCICSQCESSGFRLITFYFDRPDNLSIFTVKIIADSSYEYLLSNGNELDKGTLADGRKFANWHDPFPKPCYLFALVAGNFDVVKDHFITKSGRKVDLRIYCEVGKREGILFSMDCIKRAMKWDEERFGLEYDLDLFQIVAVPFFNMGAMENKGLNIFNDSVLIGTKDTATDKTLNFIDAVVAHEYFHNWTGDRVTCRDWFQLTLKEGLTVFRDQEYTSDTWDRISKRLSDAAAMESAQFAEDSGPSAHPIRPERVEAQDNFYTLTVYEKGAEVIRMIHTLLGEEKFQAGMRLYFQRHDGKAVTCDDFVDAMQDASQIDLTKFRDWYSQAGTPVVTVEEKFDAASKTLTLNFKQMTPPTHGQKEKKPLTVMLKTEFLNPDTGATLTDLKDGHANPVPELIVFDTAEHSLEIVGLDKKPIIATNLDFSSPIKLVHNKPFAEELFIASNLNNLYGRYNAVRTVFFKEFDKLYADAQAGKKVALTANLKEVYASIFSYALEEKSLASKLLCFLGVNELMTRSDVDFNPVLADEVLKAVKLALYAEFKDQLLALYQALPLTPYEYSPAAAQVRDLRGTVLSLLARSGNHNDLVEKLYFAADNFTDRVNALSIALSQDLGLDNIEKDFTEAFAGNDLVLDAYLNSKAVGAKDLAALIAVTKSPSYDETNPNRLRSHYAGFMANTKVRFTKEATQWATELTKKVDSFNPQAAATLLRAFTITPRLAEPYKAMLTEALVSLRDHKDLSVNCREMVNLTLGMLGK